MATFGGIGRSGIADVRPVDTSDHEFEVLARQHGEAETPRPSSCGSSQFSLSVASTYSTHTNCAALMSPPLAPISRTGAQDCTSLKTFSQTSPWL